MTSGSSLPRSEMDIKLYLSSAFRVVIIGPTGKIELFGIEQLLKSTRLLIGK